MISGLDKEIVEVSFKDGVVVTRGIEIVKEKSEVVVSMGGLKEVEVIKSTLLVVEIIGSSIVDVSSCVLSSVSLSNEIDVKMGIVDIDMVESI